MKNPLKKKKKVSLTKPVNKVDTAEELVEDIVLYDSFTGFSLLSGIGDLLGDLIDFMLDGW